MHSSKETMVIKWLTGWIFILCR